MLAQLPTAPHLSQDGNVANRRLDLPSQTQAMWQSHQHKRSTIGQDAQSL